MRRIADFPAADYEEFISMLNRLKHVKLLFYFRDQSTSGISLGVRPANARRRYIVTTSLIGWANS